MIKGHGNSNSPYMLIGGYPSSREVKDNEAFSLSSGPGKIMQDFLGRDFNQFYKTLVVKTVDHNIPDFIRESKRGKNVSLSDFFPGYAEAIEFIWEEIDLIKPKLIITSGEIALNTIVGVQKIHRFRGSILTDVKSLNIPVVPIYSQRDIFALWQRYVITQCDVEKAFSVLKSDYTPFEKESHIWICNSISHLKDFIKRGKIKMKRRAYPELGLPNGFLTFDIETKFNMITCVSLCFDGVEACSIAFLKKEIPIEELELLWTEVAELMRDPRIPKVNQNVKYDEHGFNILSIPVNNIVGDTMLLSSIIYPELPKGLDFLTSIYTNIPYYKDEGREFNAKTDSYDQYQLYNAKDAIAPHLIYPKQLKEAKEMGVFDFYTKKVWPLYSLYKSIDHNGILIDREKKEELLLKYMELFRNLNDDFEEVFGKKINLLSSAQVIKICYEDLDLPPQYKRRANQKQTLSADEESLEWLIHNETDDELIKKILTLFIMARKLHNLITFLNILIHPDGRMRTNTKIAGAETGRTTTSETTDIFLIPDKKGFKQVSMGTAFQKIPRRGHEMPDGTKIGSDIMSIFIPTPGYVFIEADLSQAEARRVCVLSEDIDFLETFDIPPGVHCRTAGWVCDMDPNKVIKGSLQYDKGKRARHAGNYGQSAKGLSNMAHLPYSEANLILNRFHENQPNIREVYHAGIEKIIKQTKTLVNAFGRVRNFFDRISDKVFRDGYSQLPQSEISDHLKFDIMTPLYDDLKWIRFLVEKHDGFLVEIPEEKEKEYTQRILELSQTTINCRVSSLPVDYDLHIPLEVERSETDWSEMK